MTITKKLLTATISVLAIAGMLLMSTPAHARFFDIFSTNLNQEAQAIKAVSSAELKSSEKELFSTSIRYGQKGEEVAKLQAVLKAKGLLQGDIDGKYGPATRKAVKELQNSNGINGNGYAVGSGTREALNSSLSGNQLTLPTNFNPGSLSSPQNLSACGPTTTPWVKVLSPNGGEAYEAGSQIMVKWESCNLDSDKRIQLNLFKESYSFYSAPLIVQNPYSGSGSNSNLTDNDGQEVVNLPDMSQAYYSNYQSGNDFKIRIEALDDSVGAVFYDDYSDDYFKIYQGSQPSPSPSSSCLNPAQLDAVLNLMDSFGATDQAADSVEDIVTTGSTNVVMTQHSGLSASQAQAIHNLLVSFGCDNNIVYLVDDVLTYQPAPTPPTPVSGPCNLIFQNVAIANQTLLNNANSEFYRFKFTNTGANDCKVSKLQFNIPHQLSNGGLIGQSRLYQEGSNAVLSTAPATAGQHMSFSNVGTVIPAGGSKIFIVRGGVSGATSPGHYLATWLFNAEVYDVSTLHGINVPISMGTTILNYPL